MNRRDFTATVAGALAAGSISRLASAMEPRAAIAPLRVNGARLNANLAGIARIGATPTGANRVAYSEADREARAFTVNLMRAARLDTSIDAAGNIVGRRPGRDASRRPILFGSHIDSVPNGGNFDGPVGSYAAIEVAQTLAEQNVVTRHPLEVVVWQNEEGGTVGSRAWAGDLHERDLTQTTRSGKTIGDGIRFLGGDPARLASVRRSKGDIAGYFELHIEQGGNLEQQRIDIGVVEGIVGIGWWDVTVTGFANHAGTTPMDQRKDALLAAARFIEMVNRVVRAEPGRQVGTVGRIQAQPGAPNVIPGIVTLSLELRDLDDAKTERLYRRIEQEAKAIGDAGGVTFAFQPLYRSTPAMADARMRAIIGAAAKSLGLSTMSLPSGAGHDAQEAARLGPMGMIFVPSVGGISHSPQEFTKPQDVVNGANVLLASILALDAA